MGDDTPDKRDAAIESALKTLSGAASLVRTLWTTFILFGLYLTIAAGSVTHEHLLLEKPLKLPILDVDLPLVAFFWVTPVLFAIFHGYVLLHLSLMTEKARGLEALFAGGTSDPTWEAKAGRHLPTHVFVQFLLRPPAWRRRPEGLMIAFIALMTMIIAPLLLLLLIQVQFLPYHGEATTSIHRIVIATDAALLAVLWPRGLGKSGETALFWTVLARGTAILGLMLLVIFSAFFARFPGERIAFLGPRTESYSATRWLFETNVNEVTGRREWLISNTLVLPDAKLIDGEKFAKNPDQPTLSLRGRDLRGAVLIRADLRGADFTGTMLNGGILDGAKLERAVFECAITGEEKKIAHFHFTPSAWPSDGCTHLQDAWLNNAQLQGALLGFARLQGASLMGAQLQGASLIGARLQGAALNGARLKGASLDSARLQGASLNMVQLQGASFALASLTGVYLWGAQLQGALLDDGPFELADLSNAFVYRARVPRPIIDVHTSDIDTERKHVRDIPLHIIPLPSDFTDADVAEWEKAALEFVRDGERRKNIQHRFARLRTDGIPAKEDAEISAAWKNAKNASIPWEQYSLRLAGSLGALFCSADGAPYIARGLLVHRFSKEVPLPPETAERARTARKEKDSPVCPGVNGFTNEDWALFEEKAPRPEATANP